MIDDDLELDEEEEKVVLALASLVKKHEKIDGRIGFSEEEIYREILKIFPPTKDNFKM